MATVASLFKELAFGTSSLLNIMIWRFHSTYSAIDSRHSGPGVFETQLVLEPRLLSAQMTRTSASTY